MLSFNMRERLEGEGEIRTKHKLIRDFGLDSEDEHYATLVVNEELIFAVRSNP